MIKGLPSVDFKPHDDLELLTIPKGTSKKVFELLNHRLHVVHAPHRWYALEERR
jgi:hypothetical protein